MYFGKDNPYPNGNHNIILDYLEEIILRLGKSETTSPGTSENQIQLTNRSGQSLEIGNLVILDRVHAKSVTTTNLYYNKDVVGVITKGGADGALVTIQTSGVGEIKMVVYPVSIGDYIYTGDVKGYGFANAAQYSGILGKALSAKAHGATGVVSVLIGSTT